MAVLADAVYSAADAQVAASRPRAPDGGGLGRLRVTRGGPPYARLRHSRLEAEAISSRVEPGDLFVAAGFAASRETALGAVFRDHQVLHFATHGEVDSQAPELSRLVLSLVDEAGRPRDGLLYAYDIAGLDLSADLVVLSACGTGLGQEIRGEGLVGLPQAFLAAGAARVLVSLWNVEDREAALLFASFYRHLLEERKTPSAALRAAQIDRWEKQPQSYDWAAFVIHDR